MEEKPPFAGLFLCSDEDPLAALVAVGADRNGGDNIAPRRAPMDGARSAGGRMSPGRFLRRPMGVYYESDRQRWAVRWVEDGRRRVRRFEDEVAAYEFAAAGAAG